MRVNLSTTHSASESSSKPADRVNTDPLFSFLAQIDAIKNSEDEKKGRRHAASKDDDPDKPGGLPLSPVLAPATTPGKLPISLDVTAAPALDSSAKGKVLPAGKSFPVLIQSQGPKATEVDIETPVIPQFCPTPVSLPRPESGMETAAQFPSPHFVSTAITQDVQKPIKSVRTPVLDSNGSADAGTMAIENDTLQNWFPRSFSNSITPVLEKSAGNSESATLGIVNESNVRVSADEASQLHREITRDPVTPETGRRDEQNWFRQSFSASLAGTCESAIDFLRPAGISGFDARSPLSSSNEVDPLIETPAERSGTPAAVVNDEQSLLLQLLSNGIVRTLEKNQDSAGASGAKKDGPDLGIRSQPGPQRTVLQVLSEAGPISAEPAPQKLFSSVISIAADQEPGKTENRSATADSGAIPADSDDRLTTQTLNNGIPRGVQVLGSDKNGGSQANEPVTIAVAQSKSNAGQPDLSQDKTATGGTRQEALVHNVSTAAPMVDLPMKALSSSAPESAQPQQLIFQIAGKIQVQLREGGGEIRVQLKPEGLGQLEIKAETTSNGVIARISTDSDGVKNYLENNLHQLQQTLQDQGLRVDRIYVTIQNGSEHQSGSSHTTQFSHEGNGQSGRESQNPRYQLPNEELDNIEEMTVDPATWLMLKPNTRFYTVA